MGAAVVRNDQVLITGWNGVSATYQDCREAGCPRCIEGGQTGSGYDSCICIHAEQHAIASAAAKGISTAGATVYVNLRPCLSCLRMLASAGIDGIIFKENWTYTETLETYYKELAAKFSRFKPINEF